MDIFNTICSLAVGYIKENPNPITVESKELTASEFYFSLGFIIGSTLGAHYPIDILKSELMDKPDINDHIRFCANALGFIKLGSHNGATP